MSNRGPAMSDTHRSGNGSGLGPSALTLDIDLDLDLDLGAPPAAAPPTVLDFGAEGGADTHSPSGVGGGHIKPLPRPAPSGDHHAALGVAPPRPGRSATSPTPPQPAATVMLSGLDDGVHGVETSTDGNGAVPHPTASPACITPPRADPITPATPTAPATPTTPTTPGGGAPTPKRKGVRFQAAAPTESGAAPLLAKTPSTASLPSPILLVPRQGSSGTSPPSSPTRSPLATTPEGVEVWLHNATPSPLAKPPLFSQNGLATPPTSRMTLKPAGGSQNSFGRAGSDPLQMLEIEEESPEESFSDAFARAEAKRLKRYQRCRWCPRHLSVMWVLLAIFIFHEWASVAITLTVTTVTSQDTLIETQNNNEQAILVMFENAQQTVTKTFKGLRENLTIRFVLIIENLMQSPVRTALVTRNLFDGGRGPALPLRDDIPDPQAGYVVDDIQRFLFQQMRDFYDDVAWVYMGVEATGAITGFRGALGEAEEALDARLQEAEGRRYYKAILSIRDDPAPPGSCEVPQTKRGVRDGLYNVTNTFAACSAQSWTRHDCVFDPANFSCLPNTAAANPGYNVHDRGWYVDTRSAGLGASPQWSSVYIFSNPRVLGLTITVPIIGGDAYIGIAAADVAIESINAFLRDNVVSDNAVSFIVERPNSVSGDASGMGFLIGTSRGSTVRTIGGSIERILAIESPEETVRSAASQLLATFGTWEAVPASVELEYLAETLEPCPSIMDTGGEGREGCQLLLAAAISDANGLNWLLLTVVPESDFLQDIFDANELALAQVDQSTEDSQDAIDRALTINLIISVLWIFVSLILAWVSARHLAKPLSELSDNMRELSQLEFGEHGAIHPSSIREIYHMQAVYTQMKDAVNNFAKFVPTAVVRRIVGGDRLATKLIVHKRTMSILFSDIEGFTTLSESLGLKRVMLLLSDYLDAMCDEVNKSGGTIGDFIGDGLMVFWNSADDEPDHARKAVECALGMHARLSSLNEKFEARGWPAIRSRVGIHTGVALTGNIGSHDKMKYGVVGDSVNLASRVENLNKRYSTYLLVTGGTFKQIEGDYVCRPADRVAVKGRSGSTVLHEVLCRAGECDATVRALAAATEEAFNLYVAGDFEEARAAATAALAVHPDDGVLARLQTTCEQMLENPPMSWKGVSIMDEK